MKKRAYISYILLVISVVSLAAYVWKQRRLYQRDQQVTHIVTQYAQQRQQQGSGDNLVYKLDLPQDASSDLRCLAQVLAGDEEEKDCIEEMPHSNYDKGTLSLIKGVQLRKGASTPADLLSGYMAVSKASAAFQVAQNQDVRGNWFGFENTNSALAQASRYGIAVDFLLRYGNLLQQTAKNLLVTLQDVLDRLSAIQASLERINPTTPSAAECVAQLKKAMSTSAHTTADLKSFVQQKYESIKPYIRSCLPSPDGCIQTQEQYLGRMASGFAALQTGINEYVNIYDELLAGLLKDPQKILEDLCTGKSDVDNRQAGQAIEQGIGSLSQSSDGPTGTGEMMSGAQATGGNIPKEQGVPREIKHREFNDDEQRYLKEIYERQADYLKQRQELQQQPGFSPKSLLRELFQEFYGSEDEFE